MDQRERARAIAAGETIHRIRNISDIENYDNFYEDGWYDFHNADFRGANLEGYEFDRSGYFHNVNFKNANLQGVIFYGENDFSNADFRGANLRDAQLTGDAVGASFVGADLTYTYLVYCNMEEVDLTGTDLRTIYMPHSFQSANLHDVNLENANLEYVHAPNVNLERANLEGAHLEGADFYGPATYIAPERISDLRAANLKNANLKEVNLRKCDLRYADLRGADLTSADLRGADLRNANLRNVVLENTMIFGANIQRVGYDGNFAEAEGINNVDPPPPPRELPVVEDVDYGNAYEVHRASHALLNNETFLQIIGASDTPSIFDYSEEKMKMRDFITRNPQHFDNTEELIRKMDMIWEKVHRSTPTPSESEVMCKATEFAYKQKPEFTAAYITTFIDEASCAYQCNDENLRLSCTQGIRERFYTSLLGAASLVRTIECFVPTPEIITLSCISKIGKIQKDPNEIMQRWSESWEDITRWKEMKKEERKEDFKNFMREDYKDDECYEINREAIEEIINQKADEIDYVFQNDDEVMFGGKKSKNKSGKTQKKMKNKSKNKCKIKNKSKNKNKNKSKTKKRKNIVQ